MEIFNYLNRNNIKYVVWKNSNLLNSFYQGQENLDLIFDYDENKIDNIFLSHGWFQLKNLTINHQKIKHYYLIYNSKILHIHAYFDLFTGDSLAKEFSFDRSKLVNNFFLDKKHNIKILNYEIQKYLFFLRVIIKNSSLIGKLIFNKQKKLYIHELNFLNKNTNRISNIYNFPTNLFNKININSGKDILIPNIFECQNYCYKIKKYKRFNSIKKNYLIFFAIFNNIIYKKILKKKQSLKIGKSICITGPDGSGKSTIINHIISKYNFLSLKRYNIAKPYPLILIKILIFYKKNFKNLKNNNYLNRNQKNYNLFFLIKSTLLSYLRYRISKKIKKNIHKGDLIIFDRYISNNPGHINGPRILNTKKFINRMFSLIELYFYNKCLICDFEIRLKTNIKNCLLRNENRKKEIKKFSDEIHLRYNMFNMSNFKSNIKYEYDNNISLSESKDKITNIVNKILCYKVIN